MKSIISTLVVALTTVTSFAAGTLADYQATVTGQGPSTYFKLDGSLESATDSSVVLGSFAGDFSADAWRNPGKAFSFFEDKNNAQLWYSTGPLINGGGMANSNATAKGSVTMLFRSLSGTNIGGQRFIFDATGTPGMGTTNHNALSLFFENETSTNDPNSLKLRFGDVTQTILPASEVQYSTWYFFALTYDEARFPNKAKWHLGPAGGTLISGMTTNEFGDAVAGEATELYIGQRADERGAFRSPGRGRVDEFAIWSRELTLAEIDAQYSKLPLPLSPDASYQEVIAYQRPLYHFKLDNSLSDSGGSITLLQQGTGGAFTSDYLGHENSAYSFSRTNDAIYATQDLIAGGGPGVDTTAAGRGTISFLFRMLSDTNYGGQRFIFGAPGMEATSTDDNMLALFLESVNSTNPWPGALKLRMGQHTKGHTSSTPTNTIPVAYAHELVPNAWYYFGMTYDESRNTPEAYLFFGQVGGTLVISEMNPANNSVAGDNGWLVLGNSREGSTIMNSGFRNPGEGAIDEFAIWHEELAVADMQAQFAALAPAGPVPALTILMSDGNVVLSWPIQGTTGYNLESTTSLTAPSWGSAGTPTASGGMNYVTNSATGSAQFFRLKK